MCCILGGTISGGAWFSPAAKAPALDESRPPYEHVRCGGLVSSAILKTEAILMSKQPKSQKLDSTGGVASPRHKWEPSAWLVKRSASFDHWSRREHVHHANAEYQAEVLARFRNVSLPHNLQSPVFKNLRFECWVTRLPDKQRNEGKSGGFRVVLVLDLEKRILWLKGIFRRSHLGFRRSPGKYDRAYEELIKTLAREFAENVKQ
jgi:hypothetical protein